MRFHMAGGAALPGAATGWQGVPEEAVAGFVCEELPAVAPGALSGLLAADELGLVEVGLVEP
jgi:hypothetical protein